MSTAIKSLFELPETIHKIAFVEKLAEAVDHPARTAGTYVVTPPIAESFDRVLKTVAASLADLRSRAAYLHGSFGSGKSHFMAMTSLLLEGHEAAWRVPELHPLRPRYGFVGQKKLLQLHFHMVGFESLEEAICLRYLRFLREQHPGAPIPGVFADEKLFADARRMLDLVGEAQFFAPMNAEAAGAVDGWGAIGGGNLWTRERFEAAASSTEPSERETLFSALVTTHFSAFAAESRQFVDLDTALGILGRHAKGLGYDAVILFLDELVLWLASRASNLSWFHNEAQKLVKLVEAQDAQRAIPFVSFIARQRDLAEMVGPNYVGLENRLVRDSLQWSEGRYDTITLEDRNLPAIVERRVLKPVGPDAVASLNKAFETLKRGANDPAWRTMLGTLDGQDFRRLYPFSPALVDALVALSNVLQRERTAIKLLTELLVEHIEDLTLGQVVGVGDLYDLLASGEAPSEAITRARFEAGKHLYTHRLLPLLQKQHKTDTAAACQRLRPEHPARLGCSNCKVTACRADNRLVKTLIVAALVPEVPALKDMTASKLVQLNHGSLKVPIPGTEGSIVTRKLRDWASQVGQLHVGAQADPTVRLQLEGVELSPIIEQARGVDSEGARQRVLKNLLLEAMQLEATQEVGRDLKVSWRGTERRGHVRFGNVRKMGPEVLRCPEDHDWRFIIDYPFDDPGFGPHDDEQVLDVFREQHGGGSGGWTVVWLPSFFSAAMNQMLGELVILEHIVQQPSGYLAELSVENQARAKNDLLNLKTQKKNRVLQALEQAYGLATARESDIDSGQSVEKHLQVLKPGAVLQTSLAASLGTAVDNFIPALLDARYPRHPRFTQRLTAARVERLVEKFGAIIDSEAKQIPADRELIAEMRGTLGELGLVRTSETAVHLVEDRLLQEIEKRRQQAVSERPEVQEVRRFIDESGRMGLEREAFDLVIRCYARWATRTFKSGGVAYEVKAGKQLPDDVVLEKPELPSHEAWVKALKTADTALGVTMAGKALHADNLERFAGLVREAVKRWAMDARRLVELLEGRAQELGGEAALGWDRVVTARSADALMRAVEGRGGVALVEALAGFMPKTSAVAVRTGLSSAREVAAVLGDNLVFGAFLQVRMRAERGELRHGAEVLQDVEKCLRQDEGNDAAAKRLRALAERAQALLHEVPPVAERVVEKVVEPLVGRPVGPLNAVNAEPVGHKPEAGSGGQVLVEGELRASGREAVLAELKAALAKVEAAVAGADEAVTLSGTFRVTGGVASGSRRKGS